MSRQIIMEVNQVFLQTVLTTTCSLQCPVSKVTLTISFRPLSIFQHTSYVSHTNRMWLSISVRPCHSLPQARWTQRPNVSVNGKGPLSIINDFFILYAYRWPIYVGFLLDQARDNLFLWSVFLMYAPSAFPRIIHLARNYPTWTSEYSPSSDMNQWTTGKLMNQVRKTNKNRSKDNWRRLKEVNEFICFHVSCPAIIR